MLTLKPKSIFSAVQKNPAYIGAVAISLVILLHLWFGRTRGVADVDGVALDSENKQKQPKEYPVHIHSINQFVPASSYSGPLKKPLEVISDSATVSCPERGGKNTQCGKVSAEYRFKVKEAGDYYAYFQVIAPGLNDNSLWVGLAEGGDSDVFYNECETPSGADAGPFLPHKHLTSSKKFLCCPAYLAKNKKKGLAGFYSDCCYSGLGKDGSEKGCVLDLEVDSELRWNQLPRVIRTTNEDAIVIIKVYAREDGTAWTGVVLSSNAALDEKSIGKLKKSTA